MSSEDFQRKLTAILSADVVGYSRLMADDEAATVKTLETYKGVMSSLIKQHRGRVVDSPGDNLLAEFGSVVDAVQCAVSIQKELQTRNADLPENRRMESRIGINLGDVIEEDERLYGDGVNIAARLEALADPGGICVSKTAFDHIESKLPLGYEFLGEQTVKNIPKPIGAYRVLMEPRVTAAKGVEEKKTSGGISRRIGITAGIIILIFVAAGLLYWKFYSIDSSKIEERSIETEQTPFKPDIKEGPKTIAVLPFDDLSPEKDQGYFVDGLSEEILNSLCQIPSLGVSGRTSSFSFKGTKKTIQQISSDLGVDHIFEGSVRKDGDALRILVQLVRASDGLQLWSETYDRELTDIFKIQEDIANNVADKLKLTLEAFNILGGTENTEAYEKYLVAMGGIGYLDSILALESIEAAIALDSEFALAWATKSATHILLTMFSPSDRVSFELDKALKAALRAIEIEPRLSQAYIALGTAHSERGNFIEAEKAFRKGLDLTSELMGDTSGLVVYYISLGYLRKCNEILEELLRNDPLNPIVYGRYMLNLGYLGYMERAEELHELGKAKFSKDQWILWGDTFITWLRLGVKEELSVTEIQEIPAGLPSYDIPKKHIDSPEKGLDELHRVYTNYDNLASSELFTMALWAAYFGDPEFALNALKRSVNINTFGLYVIWGPTFQEVRQLPQFKEYVKEIGLVDYWKEYGWPDLCHPIGNDDFKCD